MCSHFEPRDRDSRRLLVLLTGLSVAISFALATLAGAQPTGYVIPGNHVTSRSTEVQVLNLATGEVVAAIPTSFEGQAVALALTPSGNLYVLVEGSPEVVLQLDPRTGRAQHRVPLDRHFRYGFDLASDEEGDLWLSAGDALYRLDPWSGQTTLVVQTDGWLVAVAAWQGALLGILEHPVEVPSSEKSHTEMNLIEIDRVSGEVTIRQSLADLAARAQHPAGVGTYMLVAAMDFDASGNLWVLATMLVDWGGIPEESHSVFRLDGRTGQITETAVDTYYCLAVPRGGSAGGPAGVPSLDVSGLAVLGSMLLCCAMIALRRSKISHLRPLDTRRSRPGRTRSV